MRRLARQREAIVAIGLLLSAIGSFGASATQTKLIVTCQEPVAASGGSPARIACDVRANGFAEFSDVKASLKGAKGELKSEFKPFDSSVQATNTAYLIQLLPNARRTTLSQMGDAVVTLTDRRQGKRRFSAYTFGNDIELVAHSGSTNAEVVRQIIAVKPAITKVQLYRAALQAIDALSREGGDRKALVILGDGTSDDTADTHDQVVKAANDAGVTIHVLGYYDDRSGRTKFQTLSRLAEDTGGYAAEVKQGANRDLTKDVVTPRFVGELLENGGTLTADLTGPAGTQTLVLAAPLEGATIEAEETVEVPAASQPSFQTTVETSEPDPEPEGISPFLVIGLLTALGVASAFAYQKYALRKNASVPAVAAPLPDEPIGDEEDDVVTAAGSDDEADEEPARGVEGSSPVVYGWLETMDGNALRHPLRTTNVRVGRHRDNDICLQNDSISRRHAVLHYNAETRRFVITDLGGGNGVVVNKTKYKSRELNDGDTVELGDVRLRFRAETEHTA